MVAYSIFLLQTQQKYSKKTKQWTQWISKKVILNDAFLHDQWMKWIH